MTRQQLRGSFLIHRPEHDCAKAHVVKESNGDRVCAGLRYERGSWFLNTHDVPDACRECGAWHMNWNEKVWCGMHIMKDADKSKRKAK